MYKMQYCSNFYKYKDIELSTMIFRLTNCIKKATNFTNFVCINDKSPPFFSSPRQQELASELRRLLHAMLDMSRRHLDVIMPGYTHLQRAQPVRWSHWLMSHAWFLLADAEALAGLRRDVDVSPLGSGAIAGNPFGVDRQALAEDMGFGGGVTWNRSDQFCIFLMFNIYFRLIVFPELHA